MTGPAGETRSAPQAGRAAAALRRAGCETHLPGEPGYEKLRRPWNRRLDPYPALIARPRRTREVRAAVTIAREYGLPLAVQSTGHGTELSCDGGMLLLSGGMSGVTIDARQRFARVRAGTRMSEVVTAARHFGLAPIAGHGPVGVAGFVLGGGIGWLSRAHGLAADHLLRARLVAADGTRIDVDEREHPELHWALRGGGGNFGAVTSLELRLHPVTDGYTGRAVYGLDQAPGILRRYRQLAGGLGETENVGVVLFRLPADGEVPAHLRGRPAVAVRGLFLGSDEEARRRLRPLLAEAGRPLFGGFRRMPVAELATTAWDEPAARHQHCDLFHDLPDPVLDALVDAVAGSAVSVVELRLWGGAIARPAVPPGPAGHRDVRYSVLAEAPAGSERELAALAGRLRPYATGGSFLNFLTDVSRTPAAFTPENYARLVAVKRRYDPDNFFHLNHNIPP